MKLLVAGAILFASQLRAQIAPAGFEVASVKASQLGGGVRGGPRAHVYS
jgi:hypothetical protein